MINVRNTIGAKIYKDIFTRSEVELEKKFGPLIGVPFVMNVNDEIINKVWVIIGDNVRVQIEESLAHD